MAMVMVVVDSARVKDAAAVSRMRIVVRCIFYATYMNIERMSERLVYRRLCFGSKFLV